MAESIYEHRQESWGLPRLTRSTASTIGLDSTLSTGPWDQELEFGRLPSLKIDRVFFGLVPAAWG
jgi:hypothetical protein